MSAEIEKPVVARLENRNEAACVELAAQALRKGSLVVIPTDTVYGIAADPRAPGALERLFAAKGRGRDKPIPLLAATIEQIEKYGAILSEVERRLAGRFWPGPLTIALNVDAGTEGFRIPDCRFALELIRETGILRVTSANLSGQPPARSAEEAIRALAGLVDVVIDAGPALDKAPSTVVRVENGVIKVLRNGAISSKELNRSVKT